MAQHNYLKESEGFYKGYEITKRWLDHEEFFFVTAYLSKRGVDVYIISQAHRVAYKKPTLSLGRECVGSNY